MTPDEDAIRERAYEIWERQGRPHGRDLEHWIEATRELSGANGASKPSAKPPRAPRKTLAKVAEVMREKAEMAAPKRRRLLSSAK